MILDVGLKYILPQPYKSHSHSLIIMNLLAIQKTCNLEKSDVLFLRTDGELTNVSFTPCPAPVLYDEVVQKRFWQVKLSGQRSNKHPNKKRVTATEKTFLSFWPVCLLVLVDVRCDCIDVSRG